MGLGSLVVTPGLGLGAAPGGLRQGTRAGSRKEGGRGSGCSWDPQVLSADTSAWILEVFCPPR